MPGQVLKKRRLINPGRRRRMTPAQIRFFGTKRQKAALRNRRRNAGPFSIRKTKKRLRLFTSSGGKLETFKRKIKSRKTGRRRNQGGLVTQAEHAAHRRSARSSGRPKTPSTALPARSILAGVATWVKF